MLNKESHILTFLSFVILFTQSVIALPQGKQAESQSSSSSKYSYDMMEFTNVGFPGTFNPVKKMSNINSESCTCQVGAAQSFSGTNAPLAEYLSVHFRGPLSLSKFAFYSSSDYVLNENSSSNWTREAYFDSSAQTSENVTILTKAGANSPCLGNALTYASSNGTGAATSATLLEKDNLIHSDEEYVIFSNISCPASGFKKGCGVYRDGIPAYYGFYGETKMFLFEFEMPTEAETNSTSFDYFDLPAIWLLNDHIPRTSQYPTNTNCSCWSSGCGEFDIFETMNGTEKNNLYSTFHTFPGIEELGTGIPAYGYFNRDTSNTMKGGVIFDSNGDTITFLSNSTSFDAVLSNSDVNTILSAISSSEIYSTKLASVAGASTSKSKGAGASLFTKGNGLWYYAFTIFTGITQLFLL